MYGGIDQLINTYKGNPQPLAQKVQQAQQQMPQGQPPGAIPPDLEEAIALQRISELRQGAQAQQAMQAGGAQPSVVEKLRQMLGNMQQQNQPQMGQMPQQMPQQTVMAAHGGSIDQLVSNLGRHYAGGGIIAFSGKDESLVDENTARRAAARAAIIENMPDTIPDSFRGSVSDYLALREKALNAVNKNIPDLAAEAESQRARSSVYPNMPTAPAASAAPVSETPASDQSVVPYGQTKVNLSDLLPSENKPKPQPAPQTQRINTAVPGSSDTAKPVIPAKPAVEAMSPLEKVIQDSIMKTMGQDPDEVRRKAIEANTNAMGLDALLKPAQDRVAAREAMIKQIQEDRTPDWVKGLQAAGGHPVRGGLGMLLNKVGTGATEAREAYSAENLRFLDELNKLNSEIDKAKIEGRYKDVAAGEAAVKDLITAQGHAETSGTSLLNTTAINKTREQTAKDALAGRMQSAAQHNAQIALGREEKTDAAYREQAMKLAMAAALKEMQLPTNMTKYKNTTAEELAATKFNSIYNALKSGKMGAAPSAESPCGTSKPGWGIKPLG